jgi:tryptophan halogenase
MIKNIVIAGGGTAGWFAAGWFSKFHKDINITLIETPNIPKIGVGESVTTHVVSFLSALGIEENKWMKHTGAIYKYANKFINWKTGEGEYEYFSFSYPTDVELLRKEVHYATDINDWRFSDDSIRTTDTLLSLLHSKEFDKFDKYFNNQYHYMEKNVSPYYNDTYLLNPNYSRAHHINADLAAEFIKDYVAIPAGVTHIQSKITDVITIDDTVKHLILENGQTINADLFIDASGFHKVIINKLGWKFLEYTDHKIDSAWVCQTDYNNPETEMVNYTQSIAEPYGWRFKIGLYHRMGNGYCYSSAHIRDEDALEYFNQQIGLQRKKPRLIKWTPGRLEKVAGGNTAAIGLSCGFVEPLEANALYTICSSIMHLSQAIANHNNGGALDLNLYNDKIVNSIDDIANFILVHYTLSSRTDTEFWKDMQKLGVKRNHVGLMRSKYDDKFNSFPTALTGTTLFAEYMWAQMATSWGIDTQNWIPELCNTDIILTKMHYQHSEAKHNLLSSNCENNYNWLKKNIFKGLTSTDWGK